MHKWGICRVCVRLSVPCPTISQNSNMLDFWLGCCRASRTEHFCSSTMFQYTSIHHTQWRWSSPMLWVCRPEFMSSWTRLNWSTRSSSQKETQEHLQHRNRSDKISYLSFSEQNAFLGSKYGTIPDSKGWLATLCHLLQYWVPFLSRSTLSPLY